MSLNYNFETPELVAYVDMFTKLSASLANLVESGVASAANVKLCNDVITTMQEVLDDIRIPSTPSSTKVAKPASKRKAGK